MNQQKLRDSLKGEVYRDLREFLLMHLEQLNDIENVQEYSKAQDQAVELRAQKKAYKKLKLIFTQILEMNHNTEKKSTYKNDYGV